MPKPRAYVSAISPEVNVEATFGVTTPDMQASLDTWIPCTEAEFAESDYQMIDDSDEINGYSGPTSMEVEMVNGSLSRKYYLTAEMLLWLVALQLGEVTTSAASANANEQWTITVTGGGTAGSFVIKWRGYTTAPIETAGLASADIEAAFDALDIVGAGDFVYAGAGPFTITAQAGGAYENMQLEQPEIIIFEELDTAGTVQIATTTEGSVAGVYTHTVKWPSECDLNPPSTEIVEGLRCGGSTGTYKLLTGVCVDQMDLEINSKGWINLTATLKFKDEVDAPTFTLPTTATLNRKIRGSKLTVFLGPNLTDQLDSSILRSLKLTIGSGLVVPPTIGGDDLIPELQYGEKKPDLTVELNVKGDKSDTRYSYHRGSRLGTRYKFRFILQPNVTPQRKIMFTMNQVFVKAKAGKDGNETRLQLMLLPEWNTTDSGPGQWAIESNQATILQVP